MKAKNRSRYTAPRNARKVEWDDSELRFPSGHRMRRHEETERPEPRPGAQTHVDLDGVVLSPGDCLLQEAPDGTLYQQRFLGRHGRTVEWSLEPAPFAAMTGHKTVEGYVRVVADIFDDEDTLEADETAFAREVQRAEDDLPVSDLLCGYLMKRNGQPVDECFQPFIERGERIALDRLVVPDLFGHDPDPHHPRWRASDRNRLTDFLRSGRGRELRTRARQNEGARAFLAGLELYAGTEHPGRLTPAGLIALGSGATWAPNVNYAAEAPLLYVVLNHAWTNLLISAAIKENSLDIGSPGFLVAFATFAAQMELPGPGEAKRNIDRRAKRHDERFENLIAKGLKAGRSPSEVVLEVAEAQDWEQSVAGGLMEVLVKRSGPSAGLRFARYGAWRSGTSQEIDLALAFALRPYCDDPVAFGHALASSHIPGDGIPVPLGLDPWGPTEVIRCLVAFYQPDDAMRGLRDVLDLPAAEVIRRSNSAWGAGREAEFATAAVTAFELDLTNAVEELLAAGYQPRDVASIARKFWSSLDIVTVLACVLDVPTALRLAPGMGLSSQEALGAITPTGTPVADIARSARLGGVAADAAVRILHQAGLGTFEAVATVAREYGWSFAPKAMESLSDTPKAEALLRAGMPPKQVLSAVGGSLREATLRLYRDWGSPPETVAAVLAGAGLDLSVIERLMRRSGVPVPAELDSVVAAARPSRSKKRNRP